MLVIFFDGRPKETREDLYDREEELNSLRSAVSEPIVLLTGIRRIGKTSILKVFLNSVGLPHALVDSRFPLSSYRALYTTFSDVLSQLNRKESVRSILQHFRGISIFGVNVSLSWDPKERASITQILDKINEEGKVIIAFDEAQNLRGKLGHEMLSILAHCYDYCKNITFILTGSEIGLLYDFLKVEDPSSPLYGRHLEEVRVNKFDSVKSLDFLRKGFQQAGMNPPDEILEYAVEKLDGIVGWLTEFGHRCLKAREVRESFVDDILELAIRTTVEELAHFSKEYIIVLEAIAKGYRRWGEIKRYLEGKKKRTIYDAELMRYLRSLEGRGYVMKTGRGNYELTDPVIERAFNYFRK
ncbi:AAA family ATPase [Metallosphaera hakonensis]|uniref:ATP-binding protein n=1 Tax=Metallosphaera hakonensis JCM 8857 = DSM 7519 TaxID=1293036 RepID=A0A2U9IUX7_9CREN|nr:ATP-binding protein [Metallosphaera hakonensis]AWR99859.1 AAA family ATPase [Metallosphaera hakonensis JCM 8857 = DSM 7519]